MDATLILTILTLTGAAVACILYYGWWRSQKLPSNRPTKFVRNSNESKVVAFVGDSITHGAIGADYTALVAEKLSNSNYEYVNAGINGELVWNVLQRVDEIIRLQPDILTLMIGTNDAMGSLSPEDAKLYRRSKGIPQDPSVEWHREMLTLLVRKLQQDTTARIALISIPILGEDASHDAFVRSVEISDTIRNIANHFSVTYLPFNEKMVEFAQSNPSNPRFVFEKRLGGMLKAIFKHYIFRRSWNHISSDSGFNMVIDHVHLNTMSAKMVADSIVDFIKQ